MEGCEVHITGRVQGVGFRPFIYHLANKLGYIGMVNNAPDGVWIHLNVSKEKALVFVDRVKSEAPKLARIESISVRQIQIPEYARFSIAESSMSQNTSLQVSPDFGPCQNCLEDIKNDQNRRYEYAFTTCAVCGPRYSVMQGLPYDRQNTSMKSFMMCPSCLGEFDNTDDRRYFAQTNSCPTCGITLSWFANGLAVNAGGNQAIVQTTVNALKEGKIVAVKGVGGYLLLCDASNRKTIETLRKRKQRPSKPFALLYNDLESILQDAEMTSTEQEWMESEVRPILLLRRIEKPHHNLAWDLTAPELSRVGIMLSQSPLLEIISKKFSAPLIATSGNLSGAPIIFNDDQALTELSGIADYILVHNREIVVPQDDSVLQIVNEKPIIIRRSRGLAPAYFGPLPDSVEDGVFALGAHMKSSFGIAEGGRWHISQYLGALDSFEAQQSYQHTLEHLAELVGSHADLVLTDLHPAYFVHQYAEDLHAKDVQYVQHHKAHFAAVLQENNLIDSQKPVLGVIWDGIGYGEDHQLWGGEFLLFENGWMDRIVHLDYAPVIAGDKMAREPRISALAFAGAIPGSTSRLRSKFSETEWKNYHRISDSPEIRTSSMGRLFDAVASLLGLCDISGYEGHAAMLLEDIARKNTDSNLVGYEVGVSASIIYTDQLLQQVLEDLEAHVSTSAIAYKFHLTLVDLIQQIAKAKEIQALAFSGGVFQNALLVELVQAKLSDQFSLYFHKELSPNDENISFGQLSYYQLQQKQKNQLSKKEALCV